MAATSRRIGGWTVPPGLGWTFPAAMNPAGDVSDAPARAVPDAAPVDTHEAGAVDDVDAASWADPWGILGPATSSPVRAVRADDVRAERAPATLTVAVRPLRGTRADALKALRRGPGQAEGLLGTPTHRVLTAPAGKAVILSGLAWGGRTGPDVRSVAVLMPPRTREAVVLVAGWDDETGGAELDALVGELVESLVVRRAAGRGSPAVPGPAAGTAPHAVDAALTAAARRALGADGFGRALRWVLGALVLTVVVAINDDRLGLAVVPVILASSVVCVVVPALLAWRSWTGARSAGTARTPPRGRRGGRWRGYLAVQVLLWGVLFLPGGTDAPAWYQVLRAAGAAAVLAVVVLEVGRAGVVRQLRARVLPDARGAARREGGAATDGGEWTGEALPGRGGGAADPQAR